MTLSKSPVSASAFCLSLMLAQALLLLPAVARSWDFTPLKPVVDRPGHKEWIWNGEHSLSLGVPAVVQYQRGGAPRIVITGPQGALDKVRVGEGHIARDNDGWPWGVDGGAPLQVTVSGVALDRVSIGGSGKILLGRLDQERLDATIGGSGTITAQGRIDHLDLKIGGSGRMDFSQVKSSDARIKIGGSGDIDVAPREDAQVTIGGSGTVRMAVKPAHMRARAAGSGHVLVPDGSGGHADILRHEHGTARIEY